MLKKMHKYGLSATLAFLISPPQGPAYAQFLDAAQVKPILNATKAQWVAVREYNGRDLLYFTHLLAWRCGLEGVSYALNDNDDFKNWDIGTCDESAANPAAISDDQLIYTTLPLGSISSVSVKILYDDGTTDSARYDRKSIQIP